MGSANILALLPLLFIAGTSIVVMLGIAIKRNHALALCGHLDGSHLALSQRLLDHHIIRLILQGSRQGLLLRSQSPLRRLLH